jgi:hypothetical protein
MKPLVAEHLEPLARCFLAGLGARESARRLSLPLHKVEHHYDEWAAAPPQLDVTATTQGDPSPERSALARHVPWQPVYDDEPHSSHPRRSNGRIPEHAGAFPVVQQRDDGLGTLGDEMERRPPVVGLADREAALGSGLGHVIEAKRQQIKEMESFSHQRSDGRGKYARYSGPVPTAEQVARVAVAAARETGESPLWIAEQPRGCHAKIYAVMALMELIPGLTKSALGRMLGARSDPNTYVCNARTLREPARLRWYTDEAQARVTAAGRIQDP